MSAKDYFRPRGDITTVLDLTDRDSQDNTYFPITAEKSWFHRDDHKTVYPSSLSVQEFTQRGPADWGQKFSFEIGALPAGDLLQTVILQIELDSWYSGPILSQLAQGKVQATPYTAGQTAKTDYWTYINSLGTAIIEYADFIVNDQTIERLTGEFIRLFYNIYGDVNNLIGISADGIGSVPYAFLSSATSAPPATAPVFQTAFNPNRPYPVENGKYFCILPFFFLRTRLAEVFPLLSCNEGNVRIDVKLRPFDQVVRNFCGYRAFCEDTPLNKTVPFTYTGTTNQIIVNTASKPPQFKDFRIITTCALINGSLREKYLHRPFEQAVKLVQIFNFEEPLKYLVSKPNPNSDTVEIQLPLELNHPTVEILWAFRRKAVLVNNEWSNFTPAIGLQASPTKVFPDWLDWAKIRLNGSELISAEGNWFREHIASKHRGGINSYGAYIYGYSFAMYPDEHQPSGTANMSRTTSITLNLRVKQPIQTNLAGLPTPCEFDPITVGGWEVFVYAIHYNWLRFENGICNKLFID